MSTFMRYLISLLVHMTWSRVGKGGPVPPLRVPRKGPVNLPVIGPWQVMIAAWLLRKFWERYGREVKAHLMDTNHPAAQGIGSLLPDPKNPAPNMMPGAKSGAAGHNSGGGRNSAGAPVTFPVPAGAPNVSASGVAAAGPRPAPSHATRPLTARPLPQGSVLSSLRRAAPPQSPHSAQG